MFENLLKIYRVIETEVVDQKKTIKNKLNFCASYAFNCNPFHLQSVKNMNSSIAQPLPKQ